MNLNQNLFSKPLGVLLMVLCLLFIGFGGVYGGIAFIADPSGGLLGMTPEFLRPSPLDTFLVPGLFLLFVMGFLPLALAAALWLRPAWLWGQGFQYLTHEHWAWTFTMLFSYILLGWLLFEVLLFGIEAPIQWIIGIVAITLFGLSRLRSVREYYAVP